MPATETWTTYRRQWLLAAGLALATLGTLLAYYDTRFGLNSPPTTSGDEPDYDSLGWELSQGHGYQINTGDPAFRRPYDAAAQSDPAYALGAPRRGTVTYRPPLFPLGIALTDVVFGRQFWAIRVLNAGCMAGVCGILIWLLQRQAGVIPAIFGAALFVILDTRTRLYGRAILTEALSALCVSLLLLTLATAFKRQQHKWFAAAGVLFGLTVLTRSLFIFWLPWLLGVVFLGVRARTDLRTGRRRSAQLLLFLGATVVTLLPWMARNCLVLKRFMPLGTQGAAQLAAGYSDVAWAHSGRWQNLAAQGFYDSVLHPGMTPLEQELAQAQYGQQQAWRWIRKNPLKALALFPLKINGELQPASVPQGVLLVLAVVGAAVSLGATRKAEESPTGQILPCAPSDHWGRDDVYPRLGLVFFAANCFAVGMTWSVDDGRFFAPLALIEDGWAALGAWWSLCWISRFAIRWKRAANL